MKKTKQKLTIIFISLSLLSSVFSMGVVGSSSSVNNRDQVETSNTFSQLKDDFPYKGLLKIYIVEPESRWNMNNGEPYHYAFLDYATEESITLDYEEEQVIQTVWNPQEAGFSDVKSDNLMVIATVFNLNNYKEYAYPPFKNPFYAHYVDAAAGAKPGETDQNVVTDTFTHTVFVEEGTATWCPYCPAMAQALNSVYSSGDYPFYFIAHVADKNPLSNQRLESLNLLGYPSSFFDGGDKVLVGGYEQESYYITKLEQCGRRDVHSLDLSIDVSWSDENGVDITVSIKNNEQIQNNEAPLTPVITGNTTGAPESFIDYTFKSQDSDGNSVYYLIEWGDGTTTDWIGPIPSNMNFVKNHSWTEKGDYSIRVKAKDIYDHESEWATLEVSMPKPRLIHPIQQLFDQIPFLQQLRIFFR